MANADFVLGVVVHKNTADGFASASGGHGRGIGSITAKKSSHLNRLDVSRVVSAGKQGRKGNQLIGWLVGGVKVRDRCPMRRVSNFPRVSGVIVSFASNGAGVMRGGTDHTSGLELGSKNPDSFAVWVVLGWINVNVNHLRLSGGGRPNHRQSQPKEVESRPFLP